MANEAKIVLSNERVASAFCRIYYELDLSNSHAIVLLARVTYHRRKYETAN